jgi:serine phosphatase RsbU (regulator of sigma subunit)
MAVPGLAELCVIDLLDGDGSVASTVAAAVDPRVAAGVERMRAAFPLDMRSSHPVAQVLAGHAPRVIRELAEVGVLQQVAQSDEHERFMRDAGYTRAAVFPMIARGRTHGAISFLQLHGDAHYDPSLVAVLEDLAGRAALALDNARLYAERAQIARTLRRSLMPASLPEIPGLELASYFRPSEAGGEMSGDFYDVFADHDGGCWLVVGDVCGKGPEAAALTGFVRYTIAAYARRERSPRAVLSQVNQAMLDHDHLHGRFATAILARLQSSGSQVEATVALAGHPAALLTRSADGTAHELGDRGALLGVFPDARIGEIATVLWPGDSLVLYTDGLPEAHAPAYLPAESMIEKLQAAPPTSAHDSIGALLSLIDPHHNARDDIAILSARVRAEP